MVRRYMSLGLKRNKALALAEISKDQFYYQQTGNKGGIQASTQTGFRKQDGSEIEVSNDLVVKEIEAIKSDLDTPYGYHKMRYSLQLKGYIINHKKVYRLMREHQLLEAKKKVQDKDYVKYRIVVPKGPLEVLEMDIKMVWVENERRYAQILTIIDTFTRVVLYWCVGFQMRKAQVKAAWSYVIEHHLQPANALLKALHIEVRNDNGPQFSAKIVRDFFKENHLNQVFTHPYTPPENGHVESFHSILSKHLNLNTYWSLGQLESDLTLFYKKYNNVRLHGSTAYLPPMFFWDCWEKGLIERIEKPKKQVQFKLKVPHYELNRAIRAGGQLFASILTGSMPEGIDKKGR